VNAGEISIISVPVLLGVTMVNTELDRGIALANVAATPQSVFYTQAERVYGQVNTLLPRISGLNRADRSARRTKVTNLRMALELVPGATERKFAPSVSAAPAANL
jgi:hypothetical protein